MRLAVSQQHPRVCVCSQWGWMDLCSLTLCRYTLVYQALPLVLAVAHVSKSKSNLRKVAEHKFPDTDSSGRVM